ncbi:MAG: surface lipoprotein assembly modifier, partial [Rhodobacteraceae bacterium]|nr:surface lipoprotein assembly modifier [Paracoccaceae bacterium]
LMRNGHTIGFSASTTWRKYQGIPGFPTDGKPQEDRFTSLRATILRRDFTIGGFSPSLGIIHSRLNTNAQASSYSNNRLQLTLVRQF